MKFDVKALAAAAALAVSATGALAGPSASFDSMSSTFSFSNTGIGSNVGVSDTFSLTAADLAPGVYNIVGDISGTYLTLTSVTVNGTAFDLFSGGKSSFGFIDFTGTAPLEVVVTGYSAAKLPAGTQANYQGSLVLSAVPEPETYALMLGGLGALGFMMRRRRNA